jgi:hypothetical protein
MGRLTKRLLWVAVVASLVQGAAGSGVARGDIILDTGQYEDIPDPNGLYIFHVLFKPNPPPVGGTPGEEILRSNSFTVDNIQHGFPGIVTANQPPNWGASVTQVGGTSADPTYDVTWTYIGTNPIITNTDVGFFTFEVSARPDQGLPITLPYTYITTINGQPVQHSGSVTVTAVVPEPAPWVLGSFGASLGLLALGARRLMTWASRPKAAAAAP